MFSRCSLLIALLLGSGVLVACGGPGNVGESCERPGFEEDCADGAICVANEAPEGEIGDPVWDTYSCRAVCDSNVDCPADQECRGVTGAAMRRACQPRRTTTP